MLTAGGSLVSTPPAFQTSTHYQKPPTGGIRTDVTESETLIASNMTIHKLTASPQRHGKKPVTVHRQKGKEKGWTGVCGGEEIGA